MVAVASSAARTSTFSTTIFSLLLMEERRQSRTFSSSAPTATDVRAIHCDKTPDGPGTRRESGNEAQVIGRQRQTHRSCRAWLHHGGDVRDAQVLLSRGAGRCGLLR